MTSLFGIPMESIMYVLLVIFAIGVASVAYIALTNRTMFKMGLRNLPRRGLQTGLVVVGLMLATLITTAAFTTGDTVEYSIGKFGYDYLQRTDLSVNFQGNEGDAVSTGSYAPEGSIGAFEARFPDDPDIDGFMPFLFEPVPAINDRTKLSEPAVTLVGIDPERLERLGGLRLAGGGKADLGALGTDDVLLSKRAADKLDADAGDTITVFVDGVTTQIRVAAIVENEMASGAATGYGSGGGAMLLSSVQRITGHQGEINYISVVLKGGVTSSHERSDDAAARLEPFVQSGEGRAILGVGFADVEIEKVKQDAVENAEKTSSQFVSFFLILGLFSIAAGIMLIFLIFVMLATERKAEMGMARAVGAQRGNLVQSFVSEGMAYSLIAGAIGAALGVAAALALVVGFLKYSVGEEFGFITAHVTMQSLIVSYCLGVVITFLTVVIASMKVSSVNIVAAIRGIDDDGERERKRATNWKWVAIGAPSMVIPPLGIWFLLRKGFGLAWAWICAPFGIALGALAIFAAGSGGDMSEFLAGFGFSIIPLSLAMIASYYGMPGRLTWTLVGSFLAFYWMAPFNLAEELFGMELEGKIEMFPLTGVMLVIAFTLIIVFNARLLTTLFQRRSGSKYTVPFAAGAATVACAVFGAVLGDAADGVGQLAYLFAGLLAIVTATAYAAVRFPQLAPALKMGVAYPLSSRFRTGMTIAMFSLIVFSITTFSIVNSNFAALTTGDDGDGGWDVVTTENRNNPVNDVEAALRDEGATVADDIDTTGRVTTYRAGQQVDTGEETVKYPVLAGNDAFYSAPDHRLEALAHGYESDEAVFDAMAGGQAFALVDTTDFGPYDWKPADTFKVKDDAFEAFELEIIDTGTGKSETVTVIGILASQLEAEIQAGVYVNEDTFRSVYGDPHYERTFIRLDDGVSSGEAARQIESTLSTEGVQAESIDQLLTDAAAENRAFTRMFQAFMALGLAVGIIALGVIAFRSVVERRQQIGMLRAIGYQSGTVATTFVLESSFIALMGILSGVVGGVVISRNLFISGQFSGENVDFMIPWLEIIPFAIAAFVVSLAMTWWPSRGAARVPVADALRYE
jgi:putative ABC transport system permease protein